MKKVFILLFAFLAVSVTCYAQKADIKATVPDTFMTIQEFGDAYIDVSVTNKGDEAADFKIEYEIAHFNIKKEAGVLTVGSCATETMRIKDLLPKGSYDVKVSATNGEDVNETTIRMAVMETYKPQFMDEYTKIGVHVSIPVADITGANYENSRRYTNADLMLTEKIGVMCIRYGQAIMWRYMESDDGIIKKEIAPFDYLNAMRGQSFLGIQPYRPSNGAGGEHGQTSKTPEHIESNIAYMKKRLNGAYPRVKFFAEFGNEPDLDKYWPGRDVYGIQYLDLLRHIYLALNDETKDFSFTGGVVSGGNQAVPLLQYIYQQDAYKYTDAYSYHPYIKTATVDQRYDSFTKKYEDASNGVGGWLQKRITEIGWTSQWEATESDRSHYQKSEDITKLYLKNYLHNLDTTIYYCLVSNLGIQLSNTTDFEIATPMAVAVSNNTKMLNSSSYVGEYPLAEGIQCAMFIRDGKPLMGVWMPGEESIDFTFNTPVTVEDIYGNITQENAENIKIGSDVKFIYGFGMDYIFDTVCDVKNKVIDAVSEQYKDKFDTSVFDDAKALTSSDFAKDAKGFVNTFYDAGNKLIDEFALGNTSLELKELSELLSTMNIAGEKMALAYGATLGDGKLIISEKYNEIQNKVDNIKGEEKHSQILYTDKMLKYARRYYQKAKDAESRDYDVMKNDIIGANSLLSERVSIWADKIIPLQKVDYTIGILSHALPASTEFYQSTEYTETEYEVYNKRSIPFEGEIIVENGEGVQQGKSIPIKMEANDYIKMTLPIYNDKSNKASDMYKIKIVNGEEVLNERWFPVTRQQVLNVEFAPANGVFSEIKSIGVIVTNNTPDNIKGKIDITSLPDGWSLNSNTCDFELGAFETKNIEFGISDKKQVAFNNYIFGIRVSGENDFEYHNKKHPLNFPYLVKSTSNVDISAFDGNISDWSNAYPLYAEAPENPETKEAWREQDVASITYMKYDSDNIYIMTTVYDGIFYGRYTGSGSWQSDSLQMYIDPLNNGGTSPQSDDFQFYAARTSIGNEIGISSVSPVSYVTHNEEWLNVIRDEDKKITRYIIKIPFEEIKPLNSSNRAFRMNISFNDADIEVRHKAIEITSGLKVGGAKRKPSSFYEYSFAGYESPANTPFEDALVDITMSPSTFNINK